MNPFTTTIPKLENVTDKYRFISTAQFIEDVKSFGYELLETRQPRRGLGMHSMVFTHRNIPQLPGTSLQLLATNSHDGSSAFQLFVRALEKVCSNGMVAWRNKAGARVVHVGYAKEKVEQALLSANSQFDGIVSQIEAFKAIEAEPQATALFLWNASKLRDATPVRLIDLQTVQFPEQAENNAWNVFNRVQFALVRGGYQTINGNKARPVNAIRESVAINTELWKLAVESFLPKAENKQAA